uniref:Matrix-remodeling-associated protein 7 helical domain-containing protein n=1 Tax=Ascaris lumbricoides TaxID=6252 RepID=A0A9J2PEY0_ASCLU
MLAPAASCSEREAAASTADKIGYLFSTTSPDVIDYPHLWLGVQELLNTFEANMHDEMKDDVGVEFGNPGVELHSLPPYDTFRLISDHANILAVTFAIVSIAITALLWRFVRSREEEQFDFSHPPEQIRRGQFNTSVVSNLRRVPQPTATAAPQCTDRSRLTNDGGDRSDSSEESAEVETVLQDPLKREVDSLEEIRALANTDIKLKRRNQTDSDDELEGRIEEMDEDEEGSGGASSGSLSRKVSTSESEKIDLSATLGKLHGKLATAELRARANRMEREMTEQQRNEEREICNKQLEAIYAMMMNDREKFGMQDKSEIMEQMKLYSI